MTYEHFGTYQKPRKQPFTWRVDGFFQEGDVTGSVEDDKRGGGFDDVDDGKGEGDEGDEGESEGSSDDVSILGCTPPVFVLSLFNAP